MIDKIVVHFIPILYIGLVFLILAVSCIVLDMLTNENHENIIKKLINASIFFIIPVEFFMFLLILLKFEVFKDHIWSNENVYKI